MIYHLRGIVISNKISTDSIKRQLARLKMMCFASNVFMYGVLILLIILFEALPNDNTMLVESCGVTNSVARAADQTGTIHKNQAIFNCWRSLLVVCDPDGNRDLRTSL
jgi:hypothetical protein